MVLFNDTRGKYTECGVEDDKKPPSEYKERRDIVLGANATDIENNRPSRAVLDFFFFSMHKARIKKYARVCDSRTTFLLDVDSFIGYPGQKVLFARHTKQCHLGRPG